MNRLVPLAAVVLAHTMPVEAALPPLVFESGFEIDGACSWSPTNAGDPCTSSRLYAHTGADLYRIDTETLDPVVIGPFETGGPALTDIAIDRDDNMYGVSATKLWSIDVSNGQATEIATVSGSAESLSTLGFVPVDPNAPANGERLIAMGDSGTVFQLNPESGVLTVLGSFGQSSGQEIRTGGDLFGVYAFGVFAATRIGDEGSDPDFLATLSPSTFAATPAAASTGYDAIFGLAYWDGIIYGFIDNGFVADSGTIVAIDPATGAGDLLSITSQRWRGAAVSTDSPVAP